MQWLREGNLKWTAVRTSTEEVKGISEVSKEAYAKTKGKKHRATNYGL
jgi:hypothetical protein